MELKNNIANQWRKAMIHDREDVVGLDASIMMHPKVWEVSGHLAGFSDPLVDCKNCKERFRADKAPKVEAGTLLEYREGGKKDGKKLTMTASDRGYCCPVCGAGDLSDERQFNGMFRTTMGPVDPLGEFLKRHYDSRLSPEEFREKFEDHLKATTVFLRPETAQAMFVQFLNVQQSMSMKIPFGIAQVGKSFRNEIITEHFIFRSCEFEQMEMEFFIEPGSEKSWLDYWTNERLGWYQKFANNPENFRLRQHDKDELAHYSNDCYDVEYRYPWGWDELEGVASRTDYDLSRHTEGSAAKLSYFDPTKPDPKTAKMGWRYTPYVIEPAAGLTRSVLAFLLDAYSVEEGVDHAGQKKTRVVLKLHPSLAPYHAAVCPLLRKDGHPERAKEITQKLRARGFKVSFDDKQSIGKRYARHDEIGTPFCLTVDGTTLEDGTVTLRERDSAQQHRLSPEECEAWLRDKIGTFL